jgi:hypothetical protein
LHFAGYDDFDEALSHGQDPVRFLDKVCQSLYGDRDIFMPLPSAQPGDVLFTRSEEKSALVSCLLQEWLLDPMAKGSRRHFSHVSIAIDSSFAIEAVPEEDEEPNEGDRKNWSEVQLRPGVRLIPLPDLFMPSLKKRSRFAVLRPRKRTPVPKTFDLLSTEITRVLGSEYSLEQLKKSAESAIGFAMPTIIRNKLFDWSSSPEDLATRMGVDAELRAQLKASFSGYDFELEPRAFFCSQLVGYFLQRAELLPKKVDVKKLTPTGLFFILEKQPDPWEDVTDTDYSVESVIEASKVSKASCQAAYMERLAMVGLAQQSEAVKPAVEIIKRSMEKMTDFCDETLKKLDRLR